jgi:hypothetical protein
MRESIVFFRFPHLSFACAIFQLAATLACLGMQARATEPDKPIIVVFNIQAKRIKLKPQILSTLSDYMSTRLAATGAFQVVPREEIRKRLLEQKKSSYQECYDNECQIELGRELAAQKSLATQLMLIGKKCVLTSNLYDLKRAATEQGATADGGCTEEALMASIDLLVDQLSKIKQSQASKGGATTGGGGTSRSGVVFIETKGTSVSFPADFDPKRFDALGFLPRAIVLARTQMNDAELIEFDVEGVYPDGHVDLTLNPDYRARYNFRSVANSQGDPSLPRNVEQEIRCLVYVEVSATTIEIFSATSNYNCKERPRAAWRCSLQRVWALARKDGAPQDNVVAKISWLADGWYLDFGESSLSVSDNCKP